jgi:hypothetical protein
MMSIEEIIKIANETPNDMELGKKIRALVNKLKKEEKKDD